jgi:hypothetical protein
MKQDEKEARPRLTCADVRRTPTNEFTIRTAIRAGRTWKLGNKVWQDDWLAPV